MEQLMDNPSKVVNFQLGPMMVDVEVGKTYLWCSCGRSKTQPFCDASHRGTSFEPTRFVAPASMKMFFCGCKESRVAPLCDGSHAVIPGYR